MTNYNSNHPKNYKMNRSLIVILAFVIFNLIVAGAITGLI